MKSDLELYVQSEFAATHQLLVGTLSMLMKVLERDGIDRAAILDAHLEGGLRALGGVSFPGIPEEQKEVVTELAKARYTALIANLMR